MWAASIIKGNFQLKNHSLHLQFTWQLQCANINLSKGHPLLVFLGVGLQPEQRAGKSLLLSEVGYYLGRRHSLHISQRAPNNNQLLITGYFQWPLAAKQHMRQSPSKNFWWTRNHSWAMNAILAIEYWVLGTPDSASFSLSVFFLLPPPLPLSSAGDLSIFSGVFLAGFFGLAFGTFAAERASAVSNRWLWGLMGLCSLSKQEFMTLLSKCLLIVSLGSGTSNL